VWLVARQPGEPTRAHQTQREQKGIPNSRVGKTVYMHQTERERRREGEREGRREGERGGCIKRAVEREGCGFTAAGRVIIHIASVGV
jgi:hypothetical protein